MIVHLSYKSDKSPEVEAEIQEQIKKLEKRLQVFRPELVHLHVGVSYLEPQHHCAVSLNLRLPSEQMARQEEGAPAVGVVKKAFSELIKQLQRHKELLRAAHTWPKRNNDRRHEPRPNVPFEETFASSTNSDPVQEARRREAQSEVDAKSRKREEHDRAKKQARNADNGKAADRMGATQTTANFVTDERRASSELGRHAAHGGNGEVKAPQDLRSYINANLGRLNRFVQREIRYRESSSQLQPDLLSGQEVVDEVIARALTDEDHRPERLSVERWLYRLALSVIHEFANPDQTLSPQVSVDIGDYEESLDSIEDPSGRVLSDEGIAEQTYGNPEQIAEADEAFDQLETALREARSEDRQAFLLHAIEGFTVEEISHITDHPEDQVRKSIESARGVVKDRLPNENEWKQRLLRENSAA